MRAGYESAQSRGSLTRVLIFINIAVFLLQMVYEGNNLNRRVFVDSTFALSLDGLKHFYVWQLITFQFMHGGFWHIVFNCIGLYFVGRIVEDMLGRSAFLALYLGAGVVGGLVQVLSYLTPGLGYGAVVGASAGLMGLLGAFCWYAWRQRFQLLLMFIPVTLTGKALFILLIVMDGLGIVWPQGNMAHFAHLGGLFTGFLFMRLDLKYRIPVLSFEAFGERFRRRRGLPGGGGARRFTVAASPAGKASVKNGDFISREVDPILDKIAAHGIHSLTAEERAILEKAQKQMSRR